MSIKTKKSIIITDGHTSEPIDLFTELTARKINTPGCQITQSLLRHATSIDTIYMVTSDDVKINTGQQVKHIKIKTMTELTRTIAELLKQHEIYAIINMMNINDKYPDYILKRRTLADEIADMIKNEIRKIKRAEDDPDRRPLYQWQQLICNILDDPEKTETSLTETNERSFLKLNIADRMDSQLKQISPNTKLIQFYYQAYDPSQSDIGYTNDLKQKLNQALSDYIVGYAIDPNTDHLIEGQVIKEDGSHWKYYTKNNLADIIEEIIFPEINKLYQDIGLLYKGNILIFTNNKDIFTQAFSERDYQLVLISEIKGKPIGKIPYGYAEPDCYSITDIQFDEYNPFDKDTWRAITRSELLDKSDMNAVMRWMIGQDFDVPELTLEYLVQTYAINTNNLLIYANTLMNAIWCYDHGAVLDSPDMRYSMKEWWKLSDKPEYKQMYAHFYKKME